MVHAVDIRGVEITKVLKHYKKHTTLLCHCMELQLQFYFDKVMDRTILEGKTDLFS